MFPHIIVRKNQYINYYTVVNLTYEKLENNNYLLEVTEEFVFGVSFELGTGKNIFARGSTIEGVFDRMYTELYNLIK